MRGAVKPPSSDQGRGGMARHLEAIDRLRPATLLSDDPGAGEVEAGK